MKQLSVATAAGLLAACAQEAGGRSTNEAGEDFRLHELNGQQVNSSAVMLNLSTTSGDGSRFHLASDCGWFPGYFDERSSVYRLGDPAHVVGHLCTAADNQNLATIALGLREGARFQRSGGELRVTSPGGMNARFRHSPVTAFID